MTKEEYADQLAAFYNRPGVDVAQLVDRAAQLLVEADERTRLRQERTMTKEERASAAFTVAAKACVDANAPMVIPLFDGTDDDAKVTAGDYNGKVVILSGCDPKAFVAGVSMPKDVAMRIALQIIYSCGRLDEREGE